MIKALLAATTAALSLAVPVSANQELIDTFNGQSQQPANGCYSTKNDSKICYQQIQGKIYTLSIVPPDGDGFPDTFFLECGGKWESYGSLDSTHGNALVSAFCKNRR